MRSRKEINIAMKIALVFIIINSLFDLLAKLCAIIPIGNNNISVKEGLENLVKVNILWFVTVILIIIGLCIYIKRADGKIDFNIMHNIIVRVSSGMLIIFEGITTFSFKISILYSNVQTYHQAAQMIGDKELSDIKMGILTTNAIPILMILLKILFGLYLVLYKKNKDMK